MIADTLTIADTLMNVATPTIEGMCGAILMTGIGSMDAIGVRVESGGLGARKRNMSLVLAEGGRTAPRCKRHSQYLCMLKEGRTAHLLLRDPHQTNGRLQRSNHSQEDTHQQVGHSTGRRAEFLRRRRGTGLVRQLLQSPLRPKHRLRLRIMVSHLTSNTVTTRPFHTINIHSLHPHTSHPPLLHSRI